MFQDAHWADGWGGGRGGWKCTQSPKSWNLWINHVHHIYSPFIWWLPLQKYIILLSCSWMSKTHFWQIHLVWYCKLNSRRMRINSTYVLSAHITFELSKNYMLQDSNCNFKRKILGTWWQQPNITGLSSQVPQVSTLKETLIFLLGTHTDFDG